MDAGFVFILCSSFFNVPDERLLLLCKGQIPLRCPGRRQV